MSRFALLMLVAFACPAVADDWPQYLGPKRDGVWRETGIIEKFPAGGPKKVWTMPVSGGYAGPAVADGRVFVTDRVTEPAEAERVFAFDAATGKELWKHEYPVKYTRIGYASGPRATPTVDGDRVYALGAMGNLNCLNAATGKTVWATNYIKDYNARTPIWGFASAPLIDGDKLLCVVGGKGGKVVVAFDKKTGKELWAAETLDETDSGYSPPVIYTFGKVRTLVIWHGAAVLGLDPETGKRLWKQEFKVNYALTAPMPRQAGDTLFVTAFYEGPMMLKIGGTAPEILWRGKGRSERPEGSDKLHSIIPTPAIQDGHIYGVGSYGELRCLKLDTGERVWETRKPTVGTATEEGKPTRWGNLFLTEHADRFFLFNEQGELIIAKLSPKGYEEIDRAKILEPTNKLAGRLTVWTPPAFAGKKMYVRNDKELVCVDLAK
jgi:outer membrane protein assembly factor BamB